MTFAVVAPRGNFFLNQSINQSIHCQTGLFTAIDLSLCSFTVLLDSNWKVLPDLHGSDHFPIILTSAEGEPHTRLPRWRIERAIWPLFTHLCSTARTVDSLAAHMRRRHI